MTPKRKEEFIKEVASAPVLEADFMVGLSSEQVQARIAEGFTNKTPKKVTKTYWEIFCDNFFSFFNMVFFGIAVLMAFAHIDISNYLFLLPILCNIVIGLFTDIRARQLVDRLRLVTDPKVTVMRDHKMIDLPVDEVVLSDIMVLNTGDQICADAIIVQGRLNVDESLLTGESDSVLKTTDEQILSGSFVRSGKAYARVNRVGIANFAEGLQDSAKHFDRPNSELKSSSLKIFWTTGALSIVLGVAMTITWIATSFAQKGGLSFTDYQNFIHYTLSGSMEAMIPAGLYLLTSLTLGIGVINLANKHMNVQQLYSLEMLARVDTICFDKTGTLTDGMLAVKDLVNYSKLNNKEIQDILASLVKSTGDKNATASAISRYFKSAPYTAQFSLPFDSSKKYSAATFPEKGTFVLGAPGFVDAVPSSEGAAMVEEMAKRGLRVVGLYGNNKPLKNGEIPAKSTLIALISFSDHLKNDAKKTIAWFVENRVAIKVISGDNPVTVSQIAKEAGVPHGDLYLNMIDVKDEDIPNLVNSYAVFGRVSPEQKSLLVTALQKEGHKVAMTGDGVNDILALKKADCSIAMASGASAARNVAHMVSMDNDFSKLPDVVGEGRRVINNLQRTASLFLTKTVFAIVLTSVFLFVSWFEHVPFAYPFIVKNMYVWEIVTIGLGGLLLSLQPTKERLKGSYLSNVLSEAIPAGLTCIAAVGFYYILAACLPSFLSLENARTLSVVTFTALSYLILFRVSLPFDNYRAIVFVSLLIVGFLFFFLDSSLDLQLFGIRYTLIANHVFLGLSVFVVLATLYFLIDWLGKKFLYKKENPGGKSL